MAGVALSTLCGEEAHHAVVWPGDVDGLLVSAWRACLSLIVILRRRAASAGSPPRPLSIISAVTSHMTARQHAPMLEHWIMAVNR